MHILTATQRDIPEIMSLVARYGLDKCEVKPYHFNHRDIALKAVDPATGRLIGFAWGGLMAKNKVIYVDKVIIDPDYQGTKVCEQLYSELMKRAIKIGVAEAFGVIRQDQYHEKSAKNALKFAFGADPLPFTYVCATTERVIKELSHGR